MNKTDYSQKEIDEINSVPVIEQCEKTVFQFRGYAQDFLWNVTFKNPMEDKQ